MSSISAVRTGSRIERLSGRGKIALSTGSQSVAGLAVALLAVAVLRITTRTLSPSEYGHFALIVTYVTLTSLIADLGIAAMTTRNLAKVGADKPTILSVTLSSRIALSIIAVPVINGSAALIYPHESGLFRESLAIMSLDVLFTTFQVTAGSVFGSRVRGDLLALVNISARGLYVCGVVVVAVLHISYLGYIAAYVAADFIVGVFALLGARRLIAFKWNSDLRAWWLALAAALPLGIIQLTGSIYSWIDSILVSALRSSVELAFYSIAFNVVNLLGALPGFLMQSLIPSIVNADTAEVHRTVNRATYVLFCVSAPIAASGVVLRRDIILAIAGPKFLPAAGPLGILLATLPVAFVQNVLGYTSVAIDRYRPLMAVAVATLALNVAGNVVLIHVYGIDGAAWALLGSESVSLIATYLLFRRLSGITVRWVSLWKPSVAACAIFGLAPLRDRLWSHQGHISALLIGGSLIVVVYILALFVVKGVPGEVWKIRRGRHRRSSRSSPNWFRPGSLK